MGNSGLKVERSASEDELGLKRKAMNGLLKTKVAKNGIDILISKEEFVKVRQRVLKEYPYLGDCYESVLVTDFLKPDNPIVYANDDFERMTLYPKEEIIGKNCRFLQGKYTNKETVRRIGMAVKEGKELEVELLNYRKDGVPFWNNFLMLPIHDSEGKKVTHFIAIQKDVTLLKGERSPDKWLPAEVALWMDNHLGLGQYADIFAQQNIGGGELFAMDEDQLISCGLLIRKDRAKLLEAIHKMNKTKKTATTTFSLFPSLARVPSNPSTSEYLPPSGKNGINLSPDVRKPSQLRIWNNFVDSRLAVKCYHKNGIAITLIAKDCKLSDLQQEIEKLFGCKTKIQWIDDDDELVELTDQSDLDMILSQVRDSTLRISVEKLNVTPKETPPPLGDTTVPTESYSLKSASGSSYASTDKVDKYAFVNLLAIPAMVISGEGKIIRANKASRKATGYRKKEVQQQHCRLLFPSINLGDIPRGVTNTELISKDKSTTSGMLTFSPIKKSRSILMIFSKSK